MQRSFLWISHKFKTVSLRNLPILHILPLRIASLYISIYLEIHFAHGNKSGGVQ